MIDNVNVKFEAMEKKIRKVLDNYNVNEYEAEKITNELLNLHFVSQQRELLIRFGFYVTNGNYKKLCNDVRATVKNFEANT